MRAASPEHIQVIPNARLGQAFVKSKQEPRFRRGIRRLDQTGRMSVANRALEILPFVIENFLDFFLQSPSRVLTSAPSAKGAAKHATEAFLGLFLLANHIVRQPGQPPTAEQAEKIASNSTKPSNT